MLGGFFIEILRNFKVFWSPRLSISRSMLEDAPRRPKTPPRRPQERPRRSQERPRRPQDAPRGFKKQGKNGRKRHHRPKSRPNHLQTLILERFGVDLGGFGGRFEDDFGSLEVDFSKILKSFAETSGNTTPQEKQHTSSERSD